MAQKMDEKEQVIFKEMLLANSDQTDVLCQLLIEKRIITEGEFFTKLKEVQQQHGEKAGNQGMISKIISGGQTGAGQAALDVAIELGIPHGGWVPLGRKTETGPLPEKYHLQEMSTTSYPERTERNVINSDGTLVISHGDLTGGSGYARKMAEKHRKPWLHIDLNRVSVAASVQLIWSWVNGNEIRILNVAGSRASKDPNIYSITKKILGTILHSEYEEH